MTVKEKAATYASRTVKRANMKASLTDEERPVLMQAVVQHISRCG
jgi:hypothetical protein